MATYGYSGSGLSGPRVIGHIMAHRVHDLLMRFEELGFSFGEGGATMNPELKPVVDGLLEVLAGGDVEVRVKHRGNPDIVAELHRRIDEATAESNQINKDVGFYMGITV
jgi:hypothetical protein